MFLKVPKIRFFSTKSLSKLPKIKIHPEVQQAIKQGHPVVALESTIITHGLPKPTNFEVAKSLEDIIRAEGAIPATIAVIDGVPCVGLDLEQLSYLSNSKHSIKCGKRDLGFAISKQKTAGTTVSGTMTLAKIAGIDVFATGGIGGVHRNAVGGENASLDISSDLTELAGNPVLVVCAGVKSILDIPRTLEYLETNAVPVATLSEIENNVQFPAFYSPNSGIESPVVVSGVEQVAESWLAHRDLLKQESGFVLAVPPANLKESDSKLIIDSINIALEESFNQGISGKEVTPFLLARVSELTDGASLRANVALIENNAKIAARIAQCLTVARKQTNDKKPLQKSLKTAVLLGASNVDIVASASRKLQPAGASNPCKISTSPGGVGRNIAEAYSRLHDKTKEDLHFISFLGDDLNGEFITKNLQELNFKGFRTLPEHRTGVYNGIFEPFGDVGMGAEDMEINNQDSFELSESDKVSLENASVFVTDLNCSENVIRKVVDGVRPDCIRVCDPTSVFKVEKMVNVGLEKFDVVTPNLAEFYVLANQPPSDQSIPPSFEKVRDAAIKNLPSNLIVIVTMAENGILLLDLPRNHFSHFAVDSHDSWKLDTVVNVSGSGDTFTAGVSRKLADIGGRADLSSEILEGAVCFGLEAAQYSLRSKTAISVDLRRDLVGGGWKRTCLNN